MLRNARPIPFLVLFPFLFLSSFLAVPAAEAVQTGGSISLYPSSWGRLVKGDVIDVDIVVNNTSTDTPALDFPNDGVDPVPAKLTGSITVFLACLDHDCTSQASGKLRFVPGNKNGCTAKHANTASCVPAGDDAVIVNLKPAGITIPGGGSVDVATIQLEVLEVNVLELGLKAMTGPAALEACSSSLGTICAQCDAMGCTTLAFKSIESPPVVPCAPARIILRGNAATPDFFEFHAFAEAGVIDPTTEPFTISLGNAAVDPIFAFTIPPGQFKRQGQTFTYRNNAARQTGGVAFVKISPRAGVNGVYKVDIQVFDAGIESAATRPQMTVRFSIGNDSFVSTDVWSQKPNGWLLRAPTLAP
ncbi:MAG TPA: hypothetical protein VIS07_12080 [Candidatus Binatia bacterium]